MLDPKVIEQMIQDQITRLVDEQAMEIFASEDWLKPVEQKIIQYTQDHLVRKFSNSGVVPELIQAVKQGITELFTSGQMPNMEQYINPVTIETTVNQAVESTVKANLNRIANDPAWLAKVENLIAETVAHRTLSVVSSIDVDSVIMARVDENMPKFRERLVENFKTRGIEDQATQIQLTVMDDHTVFENNLTAKDLTVANSAQINNLVVTGSINTDNYAWDGLSAEIARRTLDQVTKDLQQQLINKTKEQIKNDGIDLINIKVDGKALIEGNRLSNGVIESNLQSIGKLRELVVAGETHLNDTAFVVKKRLGINTQEPEAALSVWDEEVSLIFGKHKDKQAYIGTSRAQGLTLGINRVPQIEITADGLTQIKKLQVGVHKISHSTEVPGWSGTRGDIVFNANPGDDRVFAWVCLGAFKWQVIKSAE